MDLASRVSRMTETPVTTVEAEPDGSATDYGPESPRAR
jgi:hypothetical protein